MAAAAKKEAGEDKTTLKAVANKETDLLVCLNLPRQASTSVSSPLLP
jgi:hypothetical protein